MQYTHKNTLDIKKEIVKLNELQKQHLSNL